MKRIFTSLVVCFLTVFLTVSNAGALSYDTKKIDDAYEKIVEYYKTHKVLESPDEMIAVEALGLEIESGYQLPDLETLDFETLTIGDLTKSMIALTLMGKDIENIQGKNLVKILESYVNNDGTVKNSSGHGDMIWVLFALETICSDKVITVADQLVKTNVNGGYGYVYDGVTYASPDTTGWAIEALTVADKDRYVNNIQAAKDYLATKTDGNAGYRFDEYSQANGDTQSCVLEGLFAIDTKGIVNGNYDDGNINPIDVLLSYQLEDGSFKAEVYNGWTPTGEYAFNAYTTMEAARCLGTYKNGSFVYKAKEAYISIHTKETDDKETEKPVQDNDKSTDKKEESKKETKTPKKESDSRQTKIVKTSDYYDVVNVFLLLIISGGIFVGAKRRNEEVC